MQQSNKSSVYQAFQASSLMYLFLDQVWWFFKLVAQCKLWLATSVAHLVKPATLKHHATKQDVPCSWISLIVVQVGSTVQTMFGFTVHILWGQWVLNTMQQSQMSSFCQAFQASSLMYLFLDQVWWFFKLVAQCKLWLATTVAHLVKPAILKHHATKQDVIFLSSVSSVKLNVPFSWPSVVVLQVGSTVQTMIGYHCGTSCEASDFETSCNKARCALFLNKLDCGSSW